MKVIWHPEAKRVMLEVAHYIQRKFGINARKDFLTKVRNEEKLIRQNPNVGPIDPLFKDRTLTYRSVRPAWPQDEGWKVRAVYHER